MNQKLYKDVRGSDIRRLIRLYTRNSEFLDFICNAAEGPFRLTSSVRQVSVLDDIFRKTLRHKSISEITLKDFQVTGERQILQQLPNLLKTYVLKTSYRLEKDERAAKGMCFLVYKIIQGGRSYKDFESFSIAFPSAGNLSNQYRFLATEFATKISNENDTRKERLSKTNVHSVPDARKSGKRTSEGLKLLDRKVSIADSEGENDASRAEREEKAKRFLQRMEGRNHDPSNFGPRTNLRKLEKVRDNHEEITRIQDAVALKELKKQPMYIHGDSFESLVAFKSVRREMHETEDEDNPAPSSPMSLHEESSMLLFDLVSEKGDDPPILAQEEDETYYFSDQDSSDGVYTGDVFNMPGDTGADYFQPTFGSSNEKNSYSIGSRTNQNQGQNRPNRGTSSRTKNGKKSNPKFVRKTLLKQATTNMKNAFGGGGSKQKKKSVRSLKLGGPRKNSAHSTISNVPSLSGSELESPRNKLKAKARRGGRRGRQLRRRFENQVTELVKRPSVLIKNIARNVNSPRAGTPSHGRQQTTRGRGASVAEFASNLMRSTKKERSQRNRNSQRLSQRIQEVSLDDSIEASTEDEDSRTPPVIRQAMSIRRKVPRNLPKQI